MTAHSRSAADASMVNRSLTLILNYNVATDVFVVSAILFDFQVENKTPRLSYGGL
jgi:hypothetical protein